MAVKPIRRPRPLAVFSWLCGNIPNELPFLFLFIVIASTAPTVADGQLTSPGGWISCAVVLLTCAGLVLVARRALRTRPSVNQAMDEALGPCWGAEIDPVLASRRRRHLPWTKIRLLPWPFPRRDIEHVANIPYGDNGTSNLLDVYGHRSRPSPAPNAHLPPWGAGSGGGPGAQHSFDLFHSVRFETVVDAIEAFAAWVRTRKLTSGPIS